MVFSPQKHRDFAEENALADGGGGDEGASSKLHGGFKRKHLGTKILFDDSDDE